MDAIWQWGLTVIIAIQRVRGPVLDAIFRAITSMGDETFYMILLPLVLWCVDFIVGTRLAVALLLGTYINDGFKTLFSHPRPFELDPFVGLREAEGYGLPSGHAQLAVVVWGVLAAEIKKRWAWIAATALMALIGFSRIYLGVHFPTDVLGGWLIGGLILAAYVRWKDDAEAQFTTLGGVYQLGLILAVSITLLLITATRTTTSVVGLGIGAGLGLVLLKRAGGYRADGTLWQRAARMVIGGAVLFALRLGLKAVFPDLGSPLYLTMRTIRYSILGLWTGLGAPLLFQAMRLATKGEGPGGIAGSRGSGTSSEAPTDA